MMSRNATHPAIPAQMNAVRLHVDGGPSGLLYEQIDTPSPTPGEVLVRVRAAAITRDELSWPVDRLPAIPSYEFSGEVADVSPGAGEVSIGDAVFALSPFDRDGAAAEYIRVPEECIAPKPRTLSFVESAAIPLAALSAWQGLFVHGGLEAGQRVLIHGAAGGVGSFAVQLAVERGAYVIGTTSGQNVETARGLGAHEIVDDTTTRFEDVIREADLVFDTSGGERLRRSPAVVRTGGRIVSVASEPPRQLAAEKGIASVYFVVSPDRRQLQAIAQLTDIGSLRSVVSEVFPLVEARRAFERCANRHNAGKIVLQIAGDQG
jgi:NADPH:quinone reductase-like Zn-dependent oxidoreductase